MSTGAAIIVPVYNHGSRVGAVLRRCLRLNMPVLVVDDGSTDDTAKVLESFHTVTILRHACNQGKGAALLTGFAAARAMGCDRAVSLDADGQHDPADVGPLLDAAGNRQRCLVIGRRQGMEGNRNVPWTSSFGRKFSNFWVWAAGGPRVGDSQSGLRLYPLPEAMELGTRSRRYQFEVEILIRAAQQGLAVREVPVTVVYQPRGERISHFRPWKDFMRNSRMFARMITVRMVRSLLP